MSVSLLTVALLSLTVFSVNELGWTIQSTAGGVLGSLVLGSILVASGAIKALTWYVLYLLLWALAAIVTVVRGDERMLLLAFALPIAIVLGARWSFGALQAAARLPLFIPVAFIVVLAPLLTEDPWLLASQARAQLLWLAVISLAPLTALLLIRLVRVPVAAEVRRASDRVAATGSAAKEAARRILEMAVRNEQPELDEDSLAVTLSPSYDDQFCERNMLALENTVSRRSYIRVARRLVALLFGIATVTFCLIYLLAWSAVPRSLAERWSTRAVPQLNVELLGLNFALPGGPYLLVATLLSIIATAGFLAFASSEDRYESALVHSIVLEPVEQLVLLGLPYLYLSSRDGVVQPSKLSIKSCQDQKPSGEM